MIFDWEEVHRNNDSGDNYCNCADTITHRAKIQGGWLVKVELVNVDNTSAISICFIPDAKHKWKVTRRESNKFHTERN